MKKLLYILFAVLPSLCAYAQAPVFVFFTPQSVNGNTIGIEQMTGTAASNDITEIRYYTIFNNESNSYIPFVYKNNDLSNLSTYITIPDNNPANDIWIDFDLVNTSSQFTTKVNQILQHQIIYLIDKTESVNNTHKAYPVVKNEPLDDFVIIP